MLRRDRRSSLIFVLGIQNVFSQSALCFGGKSPVLVYSAVKFLFVSLAIRVPPTHYLFLNGSRPLGLRFYFNFFFLEPKVMDQQSKISRENVVFLFFFFFRCISSGKYFTRNLKFWFNSFYILTFFFCSILTTSPNPVSLNQNRLSNEVLSPLSLTIVYETLRTIYLRTNHPHKLQPWLFTRSTDLQIVPRETLKS